MTQRTFRPEFLRQDVAAGFVVFLVALPLCLGIALASGVPLMAGIITGVVGGIVVSFFSGSELSVSGPAAGLTTALIAAQATLGSYEAVVYATILSGVLQVFFGLLRAGNLASLFPTSVINGMLAAIGAIIIIRQIPYACGMHAVELDEVLFASHNPFDIWNALNAEVSEFITDAHIGACLIFLTAIVSLTTWNSKAQRGSRFCTVLPAALIAVVASVALNDLFLFIAPSLAVTGAAGQLVQVPSGSGFASIFSLIPRFDLNPFIQYNTWSVALTIALIGSLESILSIEATDKLDPLKRPSQPNKELCAQGIGNLVAGSLGGIPMTAVIVRSTANIYAGGRTRVSSFVHGLALLFCVALIPHILNEIPLAGLAAVLIVVGYKLADAKLFISTYKAGADKFLPFIVTFLAVVASDIPTGVLIGTTVGLALVIKVNYHSAFSLVNDGNHFYMRFAKDVTFIQKAKLKRELAGIPNNSFMTIDAGGAMFVDHDIRELLEDFKASAIDRNIEVAILNLTPQRSSFQTKRT